jgi:formylglycine-generating enzyme required for sulfatase activity
MRNRSSFFGKLALLGVLAGAGIASAQSVSGVITDKVTGKSLEGALVTRISDSTQTVTDATGHFVIGGGVGIGSRRAVAPQLNLKPVFSGESLHFTAVSAQKVLIQRFSLDGRLVSTIFSNSVRPGSYAVNLVAQSKSSAGIYITRIKLNGNEYSFKTAAYDRNAVGGSSGSLLNTGNNAAGSAISGLAKISAVSDSLAVSRFRYKRQQIAFTNEVVSVALDTANLFIAVEGGTFEQGSDNPYAAADQKPAHPTTVSGFIINKYATTFDDYDAFAVATQWEKADDQEWGRGTTPVINISFYEAVLFANWQSKKDGLTPAYILDTLTTDTNNIDTADHRRWTITPLWDVDGYRLLTEAEYEYAAKGGKYSKGYIFSGSDSIQLVAWTGYDTIGGGARIHPVGTKLPNELGLYDLTGNTGSWLWDRFYKAPLAYTAGDAVNPRGLPDGQKYKYRAKRYGGAMAKESCNLITVRNYNKQSFAAQCQGIRLARTK